jgi:hypothetical protein
MPPPTSSFWVSAGGSLLLLAWFALFLIDGIHDNLQRIATLIVGTAAAVLGGHAGAAWKAKRQSAAELKRQP